MPEQYNAPLDYSHHVFKCGHPSTEDNLYLYAGSRPRCRQCRRASVRRTYERSVLGLPKRIQGGITHGHSIGKMSATYQSWKAMIQRCCNEKTKRWKDYGGRGITVCDRWMKFSNFLTDMGERPQGKTIDRKDVNGNYDLENCQWANPKQQGNNTRRNVIIEHDGVSLTLSQWSERLGMSRCCVAKRLSRGWTIERALQPPKGSSH